MQVGDLVRHKLVKNSRQLGVITDKTYSNVSQCWRYKVHWACTQTEEYWFSNKEVEVI